jgi:hypothetical protein
MWLRRPTATHNKHNKKGEHWDKVLESPAGHSGDFYVGEDLANNISPTHEVLTKVCLA